MGNRGSPLLKMSGVCKEFVKGVSAVEALDMEVYHGEKHGIVGESGCGKTTLARCALRLVEPSSGSVYFDGQDLAGLSRADLRAKRREFQIVFQDPFACLNPAMTVGEIISEPFSVHKIGGRESRQSWVRELLRSVQLDESLINRRPAELSGGQQQRVGIARSLALKPRLLVADEPVSALDVSVQSQILNLLAELQKRYGLTLILISHSLGAIHYLCTRVSVMYQGRIVEEAPATQFFQDPKHPYSRVLLDSMPVLDPAGRNRRHSAAEDIRSRPASGCSFHPRCPWVSIRCTERSPSMMECGPDAKAACFLYS